MLHTTLHTLPRRLALLAALLGASSSTVSYAQMASEANCTALFEPTASYPGLSSRPGPDPLDQGRLDLHLEPDHALIELEGCLYEVDRAVAIDLRGGDRVTLRFELSLGLVDDALVFVTDVDTDTVIDVLTPLGGAFEYSLEPGQSLGFELAGPGQSAPTIPVVVAKPVEDDPDPAP